MCKFKRLFCIENIFLNMGFKISIIKIQILNRFCKVNSVAESTKNLNLGLVSNPCFRIDWKNLNWVLSYSYSIMFNPGLYF